MNSLMPLASSISRDVESRVPLELHRSECFTGHCVGTFSYCSAWVKAGRAFLTTRLACILCLEFTSLPSPPGRPPASFDGVVRVAGGCHPRAGRLAAASGHRHPGFPRPCELLDPPPQSWCLEYTSFLFLITAPASLL